MADKTLRFSSNVPGNYYVTEDCIDCDLCRETAPSSFQRDHAIGFSIVYRQPETTDDIQLAEDAMEACPADAIGNDGCSLIAPVPSADPA